MPTDAGDDFRQTAQALITSPREGCNGFRAGSASMLLEEHANAHALGIADLMPANLFAPDGREGHSQKLSGLLKREPGAEPQAPKLAARHGAVKVPRDAAPPAPRRWRAVRGSSDRA
jgi:hypothetical protein